MADQTKSTRIAQDRRDESLHAEAINPSRAGRAEQRRRVKESGRDPSVKVIRPND